MMHSDWQDHSEDTETAVELANRLCDLADSDLPQAMQIAETYEKSAFHDALQTAIFNYRQRNFYQLMRGAGCDEGPMLRARAAMALCSLLMSSYSLLLTVW